MMSNRVKTKTVNLGRLPVFCGTWHNGVGYHKYNIVTYYGSSFINLVEGNLKYPANITFDSSNRLESYKFEYDDGSWTGWMFVSNSFDASIYAMQMGDYAKYEGDYAKYEGDKVSSTIDNMQNQIDEIIRNQSNITISLDTKEEVISRALNELHDSIPNMDNYYTKTEIDNKFSEIETLLSQI